METLGAGSWLFLTVTKLYECLKPTLDKIFKPAIDKFEDELQKKLLHEVETIFKDNHIEPEKEQMVKKSLFKTLTKKIKEAKEAKFPKGGLKDCMNEIKEVMDRELHSAKDYVAKNGIPIKPHAVEENLKTLRDSKLANSSLEKKPGVIDNKLSPFTDSINIDMPKKHAPSKFGQVIDIRNGLTTEFTDQDLELIGVEQSYSDHV